MKFINNKINLVVLLTAFGCNALAPRLTLYSSHKTDLVYYFSDSPFPSEGLPEKSGSHLRTNVLRAGDSSRVFLTYKLNKKIFISTNKKLNIVFFDKILLDSVGADVLVKSNIYMVKSVSEDSLNALHWRVFVK